MGTLKLGGGVSGLQCSGRRRPSRSEVWEGKVQNGSGRSGSPALPVAGVKAETREVRSPGLSLFNLTQPQFRFRALGRTKVPTCSHGKQWAG